MKQSLKTRLKQLWFPKVFRLPEPEFTREQVDLLEELIQLIQPTLSRSENAMQDERQQMAGFLVDLGTGIWRIRRKIEDLKRMPKEIRDALYALESTWMSMSEGGVEIVDHIGTIPRREEATVVEVRDVPNLPREQVVDTIKPTILLRGEVIQVGEVVMGRPAAASAEGATPEMPEESATVSAEDIEETTEAAETFDVPDDFAANTTDRHTTPEEATPSEALPEEPTPAVFGEGDETDAPIDEAPTASPLPEEEAETAERQEDSDTLVATTTAETEQAASSSDDENPSAESPLPADEGERVEADLPDASSLDSLQLAEIVENAGMYAPLPEAPTAEETHQGMEEAAPTPLPSHEGEPQSSEQTEGELPEDGPRDDVRTDTPPSEEQREALPLSGEALALAELVAQGARAAEDGAAEEVAKPAKPKKKRAPRKPKAKPDEAAAQPSPQENEPEETREVSDIG